MSEEQYKIFTPTAIPAKKGGSKRSAFPVDSLEIGQGFLVPSDKVQSCRSLIRSRKAENPLLDIITRRAENDMFLVVRRENLQPTAPAPTPAS